MIKTFLLILLLMVTISIVFQKNNRILVVLYSGFSLIAASLYFFNHAPDVALAEIAVGSAFMPLIFLIAISKQSTFTVMKQGQFQFEINDFLNDFCDLENLKLKLINSDDVHDDEAKGISGVFRRQDIDVIVNYHPKRQIYILTCKQSNVMTSKLQQMSEKYPKIKVVRTVDTDTMD